MYRSAPNKTTRKGLGLPKEWNFQMDEKPKPKVADSIETEETLALKAKTARQ